MARRATRADDAVQAGESTRAAERLLESYLTELNQIRATGAAVEETSYYPALANLFNGVGKTLKPKVRSNMNLRNQGAGMPDGGLYTADQFRASSAEPKPGQLPSRGAIEAKGPKRDVEAIAADEQVARYLNHYGIVLVTNLRGFLIVDRGSKGEPKPRESFQLAANEQDFWRKAAHPRAAAKERGAAFEEFIKRACLHAAPLTKPKDLAWFLASYARDALDRVEKQKELPALQAVRAALEEALGMRFTDEKGEHFFRSTLVQTLFYGVFSAWVRWHRDNPTVGAKFDWRTAEWSLHVPFIRALYEEVATPGRLRPLGLVELLDWTAAALNRVLRGEFFQSFEDEHAVQYFYEPFLEAYDPDLRKELGVWYTPREIVKYQVARVDTVLREELDLADGLADKNVVVLDPCCGTGAYLVEVLRSIAATLRDKGGDALVASDLKEAAITRVFGFEIMPAPFVVSHLQLGLALQSAGAPLSEEERVGVYLTNALTGWQPPEGVKQRLMWTELEQERDAADHVKRDKRILVVLGNPPYNAFAGVSPDEERGLVEPYKKDLNKPVAEGGWGTKKFNLDDLYIRFFRVAERRIAEMSGRGVVSFISNHSWISDCSFVVLRSHLLDSFDKFWIENLHGNRKISEYAPDGRTSETIFAMRGLSLGIKQGVATSLWVKSGKARGSAAIVRFRDDLSAARAEERRRQLLGTLKDAPFDAGYTTVRPLLENRWSFRPEEVQEAFLLWPTVAEFCEVPPSNGLMEKRRGALIDIDREALGLRMCDYFNDALAWDEYRSRQAALTTDAARFNAKSARAKAIAAEAFDEKRLRRYAIRPFDTRWCYYTPIRPIWNEPRPGLWQHCFKGNAFLLTRPARVADPEGAPISFSRCLGDNDYQRGHSYYFPFFLDSSVTADPEGEELFTVGAPHANLSKAARAYLEELGVDDPDTDESRASLIWFHALAIGYSLAYLTENTGGVRCDWPRIPLPADRDALAASAELGEQIAALLDTEADVAGVTSGKLSPLVKSIGVVAKTGGGELNPSAGELAVTADWGRRVEEGKVQPAKGRIENRHYDDAEMEAIAREAAARGASVDELRELLGATTCDVFLNDRAYWRNVPLSVWEYTIGGYQVMKKWLSYREHEILGRDMKPDEAREVTNMARRIAAIVLLQPQLDANYRRSKAGAFDWSSVSTA